MKRTYKIMDGNTAAAYAAYAFTEIAAVSASGLSDPMSDALGSFISEGRKNAFDSAPELRRMQSPSGAAAAVHGALNAGALSVSCASSGGLLAMLPDMYKMAGELLPAVIYAPAGSVSGHAAPLSGDHTDVMACRHTGFAMLCENSVQEIMDLSPCAHLAAIKSRVPFLNFFDGGGTSHELQKIAVWDYADLSDMLCPDDVSAFRARALNPNRPVMRGSHENGDIFFQNREASNTYWDALPAVVDGCMKKINARLGTDYRLFNYVGAPDARRVIVAMCSVCDTAEEVVNYLTSKGEKVGLVKVRLFRPFCPERLCGAIPETAEAVAVLDRTKEPGAQGEPLYLDVAAALFDGGRRGVRVSGGRFGLGGRDTQPEDILAVYEELKKDRPRRQFTVGIEDDVTGLSLKAPAAPDTAPEGTVSAKFWGLRGDGTVAANKSSLNIICGHTDKYAQAYFRQDTKKTGGVTVSHLRFGDRPVNSPYGIRKADFAACHDERLIMRGYKIARDVKPGGTLFINCRWTDEELESRLAGGEKRYIAQNNIRLCAMDAAKIARETGMGRRADTILQSAFFALSGVISAEDAAAYMKKTAELSCMEKGGDVLEMYYRAIDAGFASIRRVPVPGSWASAPDGEEPETPEARPETADTIENITRPSARMEGGGLPVSVFIPHADGTFPTGASAYDKRGPADTVPAWDENRCLQCNNCAISCPHAALRPFMLTAGEAAAAPGSAKLARIKTGKGRGIYKYTMAVSPLDCLGCGVCIGQCPAHALEMRPSAGQSPQSDAFNYMVRSVAEKPELFDATVRFSQYGKPLLEFSGACAGCAETGYARLAAQLFGERMIISNAPGCSYAWGGPAAASPYTARADGKGPAWSGSLPDDGAENGLGLHLACEKIRGDLRDKIRELSEITSVPEKRDACLRWLETYGDGGENMKASAELIKRLEADPDCPYSRAILPKRDYLGKKSVWIFGGDGWADDSGFGGLDHVLASGEDVNVLVFDNELCSDTGGQASKASNIGQSAAPEPWAKEKGPKPLAEMAMTYGRVYVAQVAMGADKGQTIKALAEAEAFNGPSLVIAYCPCSLHSIKGGMQGSQREMDRAVKCGYWNLFRFNPALSTGKLSVDMREPTADYRDFLMGEERFARLCREEPETAERLFEKSSAAAEARYGRLLKLRDICG